MTEEQGLAPDPFDTVWEQATGTEEDASPAVTDAEPVESAEPDTPELEAPASQPRDEKGRFVKQDETDEAETETPDPASADVEPVAPTDESPAEPEEPAATPDAQAQWDALPAVTYRAHGEEIAIPGSKLGPNGAYIPTEVLAEVTRTLSSGREYHRRAQEWQTKVQAAEARAVGAETTAQQVLEALDAMVADGRIHEWLADVERNYPVLKAQAEKEGLRRRYETANEELVRLREAEEAAQLRPLMDQALRDALQRFGTEAGLEADDVAPLFQTLRAQEEAVFPRADRDYPELGVRQGQRVIDYRRVQDEVQAVAAVVKRYRDRAVPPPKVQQAAAANAKKASAASKQPKAPPPTVAAKKGPAPAAGKRPAFKGTADVDAWFEAGGYNDVFEE